MKIAVTSAGKDMEARISPVFGRCHYFLIIDTNKKEILKTVENPAINQRGGAGILSAQTVGNEDVEAVITINIGPRAFDVLNQLGIEVYRGIPGSVKQNIENFLQGKLEKITAPGGMGFGTGRGTRGRRFGF